MGMPHDVFWYGDPKLYCCYLNATESTRKNEYDSKMRELDFLAWRIGIYNSYNRFGNKEPYPTLPVSFEDDESKDDGEDMSEEKRLRELRQLELQFDLRFRDFNRNYDEGDV